MVPDNGDILAGHTLIAIPTMTEGAASEGTPHAPHLASTAACAALWMIDAPITTHAVTPNWHSHTRSHTCHFSHGHHSCHSTDQSQSHSSNYHCTAQESYPRKAKLWPRPPPP